MTESELIRCLNQVGRSSSLRLDRTLTSSVTTAWGVDWDEAYIARDLMQNFFDANRTSLQAVAVEALSDTVMITAPTPFNLERLFYLGSEKGENDVGQYGEGFKAAATCLLRDHHVTPIAISEGHLVVMRVAPRAVEGTGLFPVEYDFYRLDQRCAGSVLILPGCSKKLMLAMHQGMNHFFYEQNSLLGPKLWSKGNDEFSIYASKNGRGHVFYRNLKRGEIEGIPVVLVINKEYQRIEQEIRRDRDRNAFGDKIMAVFYKHFVRFGLSRAWSGQRAIVEAGRELWCRGHPLLQAVAEDARGCWPQKFTAEVFQGKYYARSSSRVNPAQQLQIEQMERTWSNAGMAEVPQYFEKFGVVSAQQALHELQLKARSESIAKNRRVPTCAEALSIDLLRTVLRRFAPGIASVFDGKHCTYTVAGTEAVLGELRSERSYRSIEVFVAASVFVTDFSGALAVFLHEHAHIFGYDGSRGFTDALTELLETALRHRS